MRICTEIHKYVTGGAQCALPGANRVNGKSFCQKKFGRDGGIPSRPLTGNGVASTFPFLCPLHLVISLVTLVSWVWLDSLVSLVV